MLFNANIRRGAVVTKVATVVVAKTLFVSHAFASLEPWDQPQWGFRWGQSPQHESATAEVTKKPALARSLVFDQPGDREVVRPLAAAKVQSIPAAPQAKTPEPFAQNADQSPASNTATKNSPSAALSAATPQDTEWLTRLLEPQRTKAYRAPQALPDLIAALSAELSPPTKVLSKTSKTPAAAINSPAKEQNQKPAVVTVAKAPEANPPPTSSNSASGSTKASASLEASSVAASAEFKMPSIGPKDAWVAVLDDEAFALGDLKPVANATIHWAGPYSGLQSNSNSGGLAKAPYSRTVSSRFVVTAPGFVPAVGYAQQGQLAVAIMVKSERALAISEALNVDPRTKTLLLGRTLTRQLQPVSKVSVETSFPEASVRYSVGRLGLFGFDAKQTSTQGEFAAIGLPGQGISYLMPTQETESKQFTEWAGYSLDLSNLPGLVSTTLLEGSHEKREAVIADALTMEDVPNQVRATVGGKRGLYSTNADGVMVFDRFPVRNGIDLVEISAPSYRKTWINPSASIHTFPEVITLFSELQLNEVFAPLGIVPQAHTAIVFGNLKPEIYTKPVVVSVHDNRGRKLEGVQTYYFNSKNVLSSKQSSTTAELQNFAIPNVPSGELNIVISDPNTKHGIAIQTVRTQAGTITQVQF